MPLTTTGETILRRKGRLELTKSLLGDAIGLMPLTTTGEMTASDGETGDNEVIPRQRQLV